MSRAMMVYVFFTLGYLSSMKDLNTGPAVLSVPQIFKHFSIKKDVVMERTIGKPKM